MQDKVAQCMGISRVMVTFAPLVHLMFTFKDNCHLYQDGIYQ